MGVPNFLGGIGFVAGAVYGFSPSLNDVEFELISNATANYGYYWCGYTADARL